jgi:hypothetical protein
MAELKSLNIKSKKPAIFSEHIDILEARRESNLNRDIVAEPCQAKMHRRLAQLFGLLSEV